MNQRQAIVWGGILMGIFGLLWMTQVLMATQRFEHCMAVALLGSASLLVLARQARRAEAKLAMYVGVSAAAISFGLALILMLDIANEVPY